MQSAEIPGMPHLRRVETAWTRGRIPLEITQFDAAAHDTPDPASDNYILCLALRGEVRAAFRFGDDWRRALVPPGRFMPITPPNVLGELMMDAPHRHLMLALPRRAVAEVYDDPGVFAPLHEGAFEDKLAAQLCLTLWEEAREANRSGDLLADCLRAALVTALGRRAGLHAARDPAEPALTAAVWARVEREIETRLAEPLTVAMLAAPTGLRETRFLKAFRARTGMSPYRYVLQKRLEHAQNLLRHSTMGLAEIALASGFSDQAHMTMSFSRHLGRSPGVIRRGR